MQSKYAVLTVSALCALSSTAQADPASDIKALQQQIDAMQKQNQLQIQQMQERIDALVAAQARSAQTVQTAQTVSSNNPTPPTPASSIPPAEGVAAATPAPGGAGGPLTVQYRGAYATLYGNAHLSVDNGSNGLQHISQVSSNESFVGVRGGKSLGNSGVVALFQVETMAEISGTPTAASGLASRNSFVGFEGSWGRFGVGKFDTPYKRATALLDPFAATLGDYNAIMGNTAGEGRTEFDYRTPHAIFYDSPNISGFSANLLFAPGQKFSDLPPTSKGASNYAFPQGELVCSGTQQTSLNGATPDVQGSGATTQTLCDDGAFRNVLSAALNYEGGPLFATLAWELHQSVNRTSDAGGVVANESAAKLGVSYRFPVGNKLSGIYERLYRTGVNAATNERSRSGYYLSDVQDLGNSFDLMGAWAHAGQTPGSPKFPGLKDGANMYSLGANYHFDEHGSIYLLASYLKQDPGAHYGLGAGEGHGTPILSPRTATGGPLPGETIRGVSAGVQYAF